MNSCTIVAAIAFSALFNTAVANDDNVTNKISALDIPHASASAKIDGNLSDKIWTQAHTISLDIVNSPWNNLPSPVKTEAKIIENGEFLYIAFIASDPEPEKIQGFLGDRDTKWGDDLVGIKLDTFNNRRLNYEFFVNPFGVQNDGIQNEMTGVANDLWDGIWHSYGKITEDGYQVEIAIPFHILNFEQNQFEKTWAMELVRLYPRETRLRISHVPLDRDNACWLCQYPEIKGFEQAKIGQNLQLTPTLVADRSDTRDIYADDDKWHSENDIDAGLDIRWGINPNTLLNATINPDFSTVESDSGQLSVNKTFSLYYDEKRPFFLDNTEYFSSNFDLVYTRNIADPDYGTKLTGTHQAHTYGIFVTNDTQTNFIVPGNVSSSIATLSSESHSAAFKYRYDIDDNFSVGAISTLRTSDDYHNYVAGIDSKYRFDESNSLLAQALVSNSEYPNDLYQRFCLSNDSCEKTESITDCTFGNCQYSEQVHRTRKVGDFSDQAFKVDFIHASEYWQINANHQTIGKDFRGDLGFLPQADFSKDHLSVGRTFYNENESFWQEAKVTGQWEIRHNEAGELLEKSLTGKFNIDGPKLSNFNFIVTTADKVGLRENEAIIALDNNTKLFNETQFSFDVEAQPLTNLYTYAKFTTGDKIDYRNNRLGDINELTTNITVNATDHLELDLYYIHSKLNAKNTISSKSQNVYTANLTELRISYQFDVYSYLKLNLVYSDVDRNLNNNPFYSSSKKDRSLTTQLIYAYKLNPQTVFFVGYSDSSYQDDYLDDLEREQRTFFTKISYAWRT